MATGASRANFQVERFMDVLKQMVTVVESSPRSWQDAMGEIKQAINCTINCTTKCRPQNNL